MPNTQLDAWFLIQNETTNCKSCGVKIWKYWYADERDRQNFHEKIAISRCGPCFFKGGYDKI